jgi:deoxyribodipyrimidine photo-lyase
MAKTEIVIFWMRRDLRLNDSAGLSHALQSGLPVLPVFIFDKNILDGLENKQDRRVDFIHKALLSLQEELVKTGSSLLVLHDTPQTAFKKLLQEFNVKAVYANHDYEPYAKQRDEDIKTFLEKNKIEFTTFKDQVIFEKDEVTKDDGKPYTIFTPYSRKWKKALTDSHTKEFPTKKYFKNFFQTKAFKIPSLKEIGFEKTDIHFLLPKLTPALLKNYKANRDFPAIAGTSRISMHLRFGTISIRKTTEYALQYSETWLNELIWREFYMMILWHFPHVEKSSFKREYDFITWRNNEKEFEKWCKGETGFPIVDAGMRELNTTGFMHNRVRMITASFLVKDLLIDWRWGEAYFAEKLNDFDLSANNGGWQWAAGSGCDAAPYFRIFNPDSQQQKFDADFEYIKKWIPEFGTEKYPQPMVDHSQARIRTLDAYKKGLSEGKQINLF